MSEEEKRLRRVRESADVLGRQLDGKPNFPVEGYVDVESLNALKDSLTLEPDQLTVEDLERVILLRDGLAEIVDSTSMRGVDGEHSIDQLLNALSRFYVDVDTLIRLKTANVIEAKRKVDELRKTQVVLVDRSSKIVQTVRESSQEIITQVNITQRTVNLSLIHIDSFKADILKNLSLNIKRLSASVFAIKFQVNAGIVYEGTIRFLNEGADKVISEIRNLAKTVASTFESTKELLDRLNPLVDKGTRFVKLIGRLLAGFFGSEDVPREVRFNVKGYFKSPALTSAVFLEKGAVAVFGRRGSTIHVNEKGLVTPQRAPIREDIISAAHLGGNQFVLGTPEGIYLVRPDEPNIRSSYNEKVAAAAVTPWGGRRQAIVTGSADGIVRRWTLAGGLSQFHDASGDGGQSMNKVGRGIQSMVALDGNAVVASGDRVVVLDERLRDVAEAVVRDKIASMCTYSHQSVVVVGKGLVAEVNLARGAFSRMVTVAPSTNYVAVTKLSDHLVAVATAEGTVRALDMNSGAELGEVKLDISIRGLKASGNMLVVFGGGWQAEGRSLAVINWEEALAEAENHEAEIASH
jgi:hypothetical protein